MYYDYEKYQSALHARRHSQPSRAYLWCVELPELTVAPANMSNSESVRKAIDGQSGYLDETVDMNLLNTLVVSANTPFFTIDTDKVTNGSTFWYTAKHNDISNISLTLEEQQSGIVYKYLDNWRKLIVDKNGNYNPPAYFKRDIKMYRLDITKRVFQIFVYKNYFISEVAALSSDYTSNQPTQYTATFTGDELAHVVTIDESALNSAMEEASAILGGIEISYDRLAFDGIPAPSISNLLGTIASRAVG